MAIKAFILYIFCVFALFTFKDFNLTIEQIISLAFLAWSFLLFMFLFLSRLIKYIFPFFIGNKVTDADIISAKIKISNLDKQIQLLEEKIENIDPVVLTFIDKEKQKTENRKRFGRL
ncbi:hypothetical protein [Campylobacter corcagiensis]|uniref:Uncharacterized protein n=1 Tax=Campylobacter corcagiensis TaxID=1448857 RepID=A0A7M1LGF6_9BACT|nr:hypothetical protein [Campylobacter corcagiensis]QKF65292.1 putative membrane protein [Campylobacter corcagiensis]QOQ86575.1 hypothetical protein IMC76_04910 [Campylobacter corcagiensis]